MNNTELTEFKRLLKFCTVEYDFGTRFCYISYLINGKKDIYFPITAKDLPCKRRDCTLTGCIDYNIAIFLNEYLA